MPREIGIATEMSGNPGLPVPSAYETRIHEPGFASSGLLASPTSTSAVAQIGLPERFGEGESTIWAIFWAQLGDPSVT